jgi:hypothetical protein
LKLVVYNIKRNEVRVTMILPSEKWGGNGMLGCEFGTGIND